MRLQVVGRCFQPQIIHVDDWNGEIARFLIIWVRRYTVVQPGSTLLLKEAQFVGSNLIELLKRIIRGPGTRSNLLIYCHHQKSTKIDKIFTTLHTSKWSLLIAPMHYETQRQSWRSFILKTHRRPTFLQRSHGTSPVCSVQKGLSKRYFYALLTRLNTHSLTIRSLDSYPRRWDATGRLPR